MNTPLKKDSAAGLNRRDAMKNWTNPAGTKNRAVPNRPAQNISPKDRRADRRLANQRGVKYVRRGTSVRCGSFSGGIFQGGRSWAGDYSAACRADV